jgi:hypothetical protein
VRSVKLVAEETTEGTVRGPLEDASKQRLVKTEKTLCVL